MKPWRSLILALALLQVGPAVAELDPAPDRLGIYFDLEEFSQFSQAYGAYILVPAYIVLANPTFPQVRRWEASLGIVGDPTLLNVDFAGGGINSGSDTEYLVHLDTPLVCGTATLLATVNFLFTPDFYSSCLYLGGAAQPSLPGDLPVVWPEDDAPVQVEPTVLFDNGVGAILGSSEIIIGYPHFCETVVEDRQIDWGAVKALYR